MGKCFKIAAIIAKRSDVEIQDALKNDKVTNMAQQQKRPGNAGDKRNSWARGRGAHSMRGELKHAIALRKRELNRKVRHTKLTLQHSSYKRIESTLKMIDFS